jgi:hypothetical protein
MRNVIQYKSGEPLMIGQFDLLFGSIGLHPNLMCLRDNDLPIPHAS